MRPTNGWWLWITSCNWETGCCCSKTKLFSLGTMSQNVLHWDVSSTCPMCSANLEKLTTLWQAVVLWTTLSNNQVASIVQWKICKHFGVQWQVDSSDINLIGLWRQRTSLRCGIWSSLLQRRSRPTFQTSVSEIRIITPISYWHQLSCCWQHWQ
jgi:hypothetical protein